MRTSTKLMIMWRTFSTSIVLREHRHRSAVASFPREYDSVLLDAPKVDRA